MKRYLMLLLALLLRTLPLAAQTGQPPGALDWWQPMPKYFFRGGGRVQTRQILFNEDFSRPSAGFEQLRSQATTQRLLRLSRGRNRAMRLYATYALIDRRYPQLVPVLAYQLRHDAAIRYTQRKSFGVLVGYMHASGGIWRRIRTRAVEAATPADSLYYMRLLQQLDSAGLQRAVRGRHVHPEQLDNYLVSNTAYPGSYHLVRQLYAQEQTADYFSPNLAGALAEYRRPADVPLFHALPQYQQLVAVAHFPHPSFWPLLTALVGKESDDVYLEALASYQDARAARLLDSLDRYRLLPGRDTAATRSRLAGALSYHYYSGYDSLLTRLWLRDHILTSASLHTFIHHDSARAVAVLARGLLGFGPNDYLHLQDFEPYSGVQEAVMRLMLQRIARGDTATFRVVMQHGAQHFTDHDLEALATIIRQQRLTWTQPALLRHVQAEDANYDLRILTQTLLSFDDPRLNRELRRIMTARLSPGTAPSWLETVNDQLEKHGLAPLPAAPAP